MKNVQIIIGSVTIVLILLFLYKSIHLGNLTNIEIIHSKILNCPKYNGSYAQCTNNNMYATNGCDLVLYQLKNTCDPLRPIHLNNGKGTGRICKYPRVNTWNSCDFNSNYNFMIQCKNCQRPFTDE